MGGEILSILLCLLLRLSELLGEEVKMLSDCVGDDVASDISFMKNGDVVFT